MKSSQSLLAVFLIIVSSFSVALNMAYSEDAIESAETTEPEEPSIHDPMRFALELISKTCQFKEKKKTFNEDVLAASRKRYIACMSDGLVYIAANLIEPKTDPRFIELTRSKIYCANILGTSQARCLNTSFNEVMDSETLSTPVIAMNSCNVYILGYDEENKCLLEAVRLWGNPKADRLLELCDGISDSGEQYECFRRALNLVLENAAPKFDG